MTTTDRRVAIDLRDGCLWLRWADTGRDIGPYPSDLESASEIVDVLRGGRSRAMNGRRRATISAQGCALGVDIGAPVADWHSRIRLTWTQAAGLADAIERVLLLASTCDDST